MMVLNQVEFYIMNHPIRAFVQERYELPVFLKLSSRRRYSRVLEIGCGSGNGSRLLGRYYRLSHLFAVDIDRRMIRLARQKNCGRPVHFLAMDASNLAFPENSFDAVFDFGMVHHIPNWRDCIRELRRVLKDGGELILEELSIESFSGLAGTVWKKLLSHPYEQMFTVKEFESCLRENGFTIVALHRGNWMGVLKHISLVARANGSRTV